MEQAILLEMVTQNRYTSSFTFNRITAENARYRVNDRTASVGFIYRHLGEALCRFGNFLGAPSDVVNTTMGREDEGEAFDLATSRQLVEQGYQMLERVIRETSAEGWLETVDTPFFGTVSKARMFAHALFHTSHHAGQISLTLSRGG